VAATMGFTRGMWFNSAADIFDEFARSTAGRPNDQSGLTHTTLKAKGPQLWPYPALLGKSIERRYTDGVFPTISGKAKFLARPHVEQEEKPTADFPLLLTTGRLPNHWHTLTKSGTVPALTKADNEPYVQMHPADAEALFLTNGQPLVVQSTRGTARTNLRVDHHISPGTVFMPMHWNELYGESISCNESTSDARDPLSKQPSLKYCAVRVSAEVARPKTEVDIKKVEAPTQTEPAARL